MRIQIVGQPSRVFKHRGFTLLELMVTIAIAAILAALAAPSLQSIIAKNAFYNVSSEFNGSMLRARNEAISKNTCVTICRSESADSDAPKCAAVGGDWQTGWIAFLEPTCSAAVDAPAVAEDMILARSAGNTKYVLKAPDGTTFGPEGGGFVQFGPLGRTNLKLATNPSLILSSTDTALSEKYGSIICIDPMGRTRGIAFNGNCANP